MVNKLIGIALFLALLLGCSAPQEPDSVFKNPVSENSMYPYLYQVDDKLYMSWLTSNSDGSHSLKYATFDNEQWSAVNTIATDSTWFVNWADFPSIIADENGAVAAHWLNKKEGGPYAYDVHISMFNEDSSNWSPAITPHTDNTPTEHGFVSMVPWNENSFLAVWLDGRQTDGRSDEDYYNLDYAMTLRGAIINENGKVEQHFIIDKSVCDCCPTSLIKSGDTAIVAYRNRTENEIRDIYTSQFNGQEWSSPKAVHDDNWEIGACPVNGPKLAVEDSLVAVAWHTAAQDTPTAKFAYSTDYGQTFGDPVILNEQTSLGRVDAEIADGQIYLSWMEKSESGTELKLSAFDKNKQFKSPTTVTRLDESRKSGFPQMEQLGNDLIFAWTNVDSSKTKIITKKISLD